MTSSLIINVPQHLGMPRRILSGMVTFGLWCLWCGLWLPIIHNYHYLVHCCGSYSLAAVRLVDGATAISAEHVATVLLGTATTLLLWSLLPSHRQARPHRRNSLSDYARHFGLDVADVLRGHDASVCTVHHDEQGRITAIVRHPAP